MQFLSFNIALDFLEAIRHYPIAASKQCPRPRNRPSASLSSRLRAHALSSETRPVEAADALRGMHLACERSMSKQ